MYLWQNNRPEFHRLMAMYKSNLVPRRNELIIEATWYPPNPANKIVGWATWQDLDQAYQSGDLVQLPQAAKRFGFEIDKNIGAMADSDVRHLYRGLTPQAVGLLCYIASEVRQQSKRQDALLRVTSLTRSVALQRKFVAKGLSPAAYSTHCAGVAFDIAPPNNKNILAALEYVLYDLRYRGDLCFARERKDRRGDHFHVTLSPFSAEKFSPVWYRADQYWGLVQKVEAEQKSRPIAQKPLLTFAYILWLLKWVSAIWGMGVVVTSVLDPLYNPHIRRDRFAWFFRSLLWYVTLYYWIKSNRASL
jgi:hypothetical protein